MDENLLMKIVVYFSMKIFLYLTRDKMKEKNLFNETGKNENFSLYKHENEKKKIINNFVI